MLRLLQCPQRRKAVRPSIHILFVSLVVGHFLEDSSGSKAFEETLQTFLQVTHKVVDPHAFPVVSSGGGDLTACRSYNSNSQKCEQSSLLEGSLTPPGVIRTIRIRRFIVKHGRRVKKTINVSLENKRL